MRPARRSSHIDQVTTVIEVDSLHKSYRSRRGRRVRALDGLELSVRAGGVFGFLGPNGSGKTTTIRCLLGLARPSAGHCRVLGRESPGDLPEVIARVGSLVEMPGVNPGVSGRQTLAVLAATAGIGRRSVDATLEKVGLAERADDLVRGYSLGMRQRLGIAIALLKDPELLILDEPANGLDPEGIREVRQLIHNLGAEGRTVFLSSHLLSEVEQVCDEVAIVAARPHRQPRRRRRCPRQRPTVGDVGQGRRHHRRCGDAGPRRLPRRAQW